MSGVSLRAVVAGAVVGACMAAEAAPFVPEWKKQAAIEKPRLEKIEAVGSGELRVEAMFASAGITYGAARTEGLKFEYRKSPGVLSALFGGGEWTAAHEPYWFDEVSNYRGMVWDLEEDTSYELRVTAGGKTLAKTTFRTWRSDVPIARTVEIDPATAKFPMTVSDRGTPDGWVRYVVKDGAVLRAQVAEGQTAITVTNAAYVTFDGMRIEAPGARNVFVLLQSTGVRIRNCDISRFGVMGRCHVDFAGRYFTGWDKRRRRPAGGNICYGIYVGSGMRETVVERCFIHDPVGRSTAWRYSHPAGPMAMVMASPAHSTSIRFNDFVGSDAHRWDDAVGGHGNFNPDGGFNRTGEVYGNFMIFPNDDSIELDGGQQNVVCFKNRFEGGLVGVSIQGNVVSPSFVVDNLFSGMDDEFGEPGQTIKTSGFDIYGQGPYSLVMRNVLWGRGSGLGISVRKCGDPNHPSSDAGRVARIDVIDNVFCGKQSLRGQDAMPECVVRGNRMKADLSEADLDRARPFRPLPFLLDTVRIDAGRDHSPRTVKVKGGDGVRFEIVKCEAFDWFEVEPKDGTLKDGMALTVRFDEARMKDAPVYRGAFLVRTPDGLSRPVSLYATTGWAQPERCEKPGDVAVYAHPEDAVRDAEGYSVYTFTAPKKARYYFMAFVQADDFSHVTAAVDGEDPARSIVQSAVNSPVWSIIAPGAPEWSIKPGRVRFYDLEPGEHRLRIKGAGGDFRPKAFVMTDNPLSFEPKVFCGKEPFDLSAAFGKWPAGKDPKTVARRIVRQFASCSPWAYKPQGYAGNNGYGLTKMPGLHYCVAILWAHALKCARLVGDAETERTLLSRFEECYGPKAEAVPPACHVDLSVFGLLPLEVFALNGDGRAKEMGLSMAERQWARPQESDYGLMAPSVAEQNPPFAEQMDYWRAGYTAQTRLWIDDMFMITALQAAAYRATGDRKYVDRAAKEMVLYLDKLQIREAGKGNGLFYHAPDVPFFWARGDGWMAAGMAMLLDALPKDNPDRARILGGYRLMMAALMRKQRESDGMWNQLLGDDTTWAETSGTGMFAYAFVIGAKRGWINPAVYGPRARKAYLSLVDRLDAYGNVADVCIGTAKKNDRQYYRDRTHVNGDPHGQFPLLWICEALLDAR